MGFEADGGILPILKAVSCKSKITSASIHPFGFQCRHTHMAKHNVIWVIGLVMQPGRLARPLHYLLLSKLTFGETKLEGGCISCPGRSDKLRAIDFESATVSQQEGFVTRTARSHVACMWIGVQDKPLVLHTNPHARLPGEIAMFRHLRGYVIPKPSKWRLSTSAKRTTGQVSTILLV